VIAFSTLQWIYLGILVAMTGAAGLFGVFVVAQLFRNPGGSSRRRVAARGVRR
jgi:hypothetical protein